MTTEEIYNVIQKLVGEIVPIGESNVDRERLANLKTLIEVMTMFLREINFVKTHNADRMEHSMKIIAERAALFLDGLKEFSR